MTFASDIGVTINGNYVNFNESTGYPFVDDSSRTQVPLRATMEAFGCDVSWDQDNFCAYVSKDDTVITVPVGKNYIYKNGSIIKNDTASQIKNERIYLPIRIVLESFGSYVDWDSEKNSVTIDTLSQLMQVHFIDVGQGDSVLIDYGNYEILIDGGDNNKGEIVCNYIKPYIDGNIELVIATHPDADHIGGLDDVLSNYSVTKVIDSGFYYDTKTYADYINAVRLAGCIYEQDYDFVLELDDNVSLSVVDTGDNWGNSNDMSVVSLLSYNETSVLLTGDISQNVECVLLNKLGVTDVLKVAHHGSKTSSSQAFLDVIKPSYAVISAGMNNRYGHPATETVDRLIASGTKVLGTYNSGNIILNINKNGYSFNKSDFVVISDFNDIYLSGYVGNKYSKKFHSADCSYAKKISEDNRVRFASRNDAIYQGYVPCRVCNP